MLIKNLLILVVVTALAFGVQSPAAAVEFKLSGTWEIGMGWAKNVSFYNEEQSGEKTKSFAAAHRLWPQLDIIASDTLRTVLALEITSIVAGRGMDSRVDGDIDADIAKTLQLRKAYLEWMAVPDLTLRVGAQNGVLPAVAFGSPVWDDDAMGVGVGYKFNDMFALNMLWARPFDSNIREADGRSPDHAMDIFTLDMPITSEGFSVTPWGVYAHTGKASRYWNYRSDYTGGFNLTDYTGSLSGSSSLWWIGMAADLNFFEPFSLKLDAMYGSAKGDDTPEFSGWLMAGLFEYNSDAGWGTPGLLGWYASGDKADSYERGAHGTYGRMPVIGTNRAGFAPTALGYAGSEGCVTDSLISTSGVGSWGLGLQLADLSFIDRLSHTMRAVYIRGTNHEDMVKNGGADRGGEPYNIQNDFFYMTRKDYAVEMDLINTFDVSESVKIHLETGFIHMNLNNNVWGTLADTSNVWKMDLLLTYSF